MPQDFSAIIDDNLSHRLLFAAWSKEPRRSEQCRRTSRRYVLLLATAAATVALLLLKVLTKPGNSDTVLGHALSQKDADLLGLPSKSHARNATAIPAQNPWRGSGNRHRTDLLVSVSGCGGKYRPRLENGAEATVQYVVRDARGVVIDSTQGRRKVNLVLGKGQVSKEIESHLAGVCGGEVVAFEANNRLFTIYVSRVGSDSKDDVMAARLESLAMSLHVVSGRRGQSCTHACQKHGLTCEPDGFKVINECPRMRRVFPCKSCETAAAGSSGPDMPCYVEPTAPRGHPREFCMVNPVVDSATCDAKYVHTRRICPCAPLSNTTS